MKLNITLNASNEFGKVRQENLQQGAGIMQRMGRILIAAIFLISGIGKIPGWSDTLARMTEKGMPAVELLLAGAIAFEIFGALSLITGYRLRLGALALMIFLIPATLIFHGFWAVEGAAQRMEMIQFLKNLAIFGGLMMVFSTAGKAGAKSKKG